MYKLTQEELSILKRLNTPEKIQRYIDEDISYNKEKDGETCRSPRRVLRDMTGHCFEGGLLAVAALRVNGHPPLVVDLEADPTKDDDHILAIETLTPADFSTLEAVTKGRNWKLFP